MGKVCGKKELFVLLKTKIHIKEKKIEIKKCVKTIFYKAIIIFLFIFGSACSKGVFV
jgi:hypothetical protein